MAVLAIDTCLAALTLAVETGDGRRFSVSNAIGTGHAETIAPAFARLCAEAGVAPSSLGRIGVTVGPGSFMGQRVGIAFAKGLAMASGADTVALTTLEAVALGAGYPVAVVVDARREQVYAQGFLDDGAPDGEPRLLSLSDAAVWLARWDRAAGSGLSALESPLHPAGPDLPQPDALLSLTLAKPPSPLATLYLRAPDAKAPTRPAL